LGFEIDLDLFDELVKISPALEDVIDEASVIHRPVPVNQAVSNTV